MHPHDMKSPLLDVIGFASLLFTSSLLAWILRHEPMMRAIGSYGAAIVVVWRAVVLSRRAYKRWAARRLEDKHNESH